ncbi:hypothetical protein [Herbiconiux ginsengi]|uniref:Lipoprotein n=1 Tax=Herbiconiux ginsengi TaxID=381665 RepID=A0A1H3TMH3_9MICO|nr:hypothetical protein [Herbiconiux ginsengi]SDZ51187.1 hypothetical protein SAMN05216554_4341 [Herbiconiux ginsengi]
MGMRRPAALTGAVLAVLLTASGCAAGAPQPTPTVTVTVTATPTPTPTAAPTPTDAPAPDPAAYSPGDVGTWVIDYAGIGPFVLDETLADVQAQVPASVETCRPGVDTYQLGGIGFTAVSGIDESDPAAPIVVVRMLGLDGFDPAAPQPRTEKGIGIGSTVTELQAAYPELESYQGMNKSTIYRIAADGRTVNFEDFGTGEIQIISVAASAGVGSEYCGA